MATNSPVTTPSCSFCACMKARNLNDPVYLKWCLGAFCIYPCWCYIQYKVMKKLEIKDKVADTSSEGLVSTATPRPSTKCCQCICNCICHPLMRSLMCCCLGLAINRSYIRIYQEKQELYPLDCCLFLFCGYCVITQDIELAYPGQPRDGTPYKTNGLSCIKPSYFCKFANFLVCLGLCLMPVPCYCLVQACTVAHLGKGNSFTCACIRPIFLCCFGFALNRDKISAGRGHHRYFCYDCILYSCPFSCCCLIMQEYLEGRNANLTRIHIV